MSQVNRIDANQIISKRNYGGSCGCFGGITLTTDLTNKVVIVTGSNTGIGKETARVVALHGATVILACRGAVKSTKVAEELRKTTGNKHIEFMHLDLSDLRSIKEFADQFKSKYDRLNILVNNAGVNMLPDRRLTADGFEMQFGTNHIGHFYLTNLLIDVMKNSAPARIVNVSSTIHEKGKIKWEDLQHEQGYDIAGFAAFTQSKLANVMFTKELQRRYAKEGITSYSLHPGVVRTDATRHVARKWYFMIPYYLCLLPGMILFGKSLEDGAKTTLFCCLQDTDELVGGAYYADCKPQKANKLADDENNNKRLWEVTEKLIKDAPRTKLNL